MVRNISDTGAMPDLTNPVELPEQFTLALPADGQHMSCHVVWRRGKRIAVAFDWSPLLHQLGRPMRAREP
jgi:hypothetical protein